MAIKCDSLLLKSSEIIVVLFLCAGTAACSKNNSSLEIQVYQCKQDAFGGNANVIGEVTNTQVKLIYNLTAVVELRDSNDKLVGSASAAVTPNPLKPTQTAHFRIKTDYRVDNGSCRVFFTNPVGKVILRNREYQKIHTSVLK